MRPVSGVLVEENTEDFFLSKLEEQLKELYEKGYQVYDVKYSHLLDDTETNTTTYSALILIGVED